MKQFATFHLNEYYFGLNVLLVREVNKSIDITPVDGALPFIKGLMNLRGLIVTVLDPGEKLSLGSREVTEETRCVVLKTDSEVDRIRATGVDLERTYPDLVGLLVDRIGDMVNVEDDDIEAPPANSGGVDGKYIEGIVKLENDLLIVLNVTELLGGETE